MPNYINPNAKTNPTSLNRTTDPNRIPTDPNPNSSNLVTLTLACI